MCSHRSCPTRHYSRRNGKNCDTPSRTIGAGTRSRPTGLRRSPPDTNRLMRIYGGGRGLHEEPSVASVAALQPSQWRKGDGAAAERALRV